MTEQTDIDREEDEIFAIFQGMKPTKRARVDRAAVEAETTDEGSTKASTDDTVSEEEARVFDFTQTHANTIRQRREAKRDTQKT